MNDPVAHGLIRLPATRSRFEISKSRAVPAKYVKGSGKKKGSFARELH